MTLRVALVGAGAWGKNLARVVSTTPGAALVAVVEPRALERQRVVQMYSTIEKSVAECDATLFAAVDAVIVATPADRHFDVAHAALSRGLATLIEKPLVKSLDEARTLALVAHEAAALGMVGHLLAHHPAVRHAIDLATSGRVGTLQTLRSIRTGPSDTGSEARDTLWELGPHDLSVVYHLGYRAPQRLDVVDLDPATVALSGEFEGPAGRLGLEAELSRHQPHKVRRLVFEGTRGRIIHDDVLDPFGLHVETAAGRMRVPVPPAEPLAVEIARFVGAARGEGAVVTSLEEGAAIVGWIVDARTNGLRAADRDEPRSRGRALVVSAASGDGARANALPRPLQAPSGCLPSAGPTGHARDFHVAFPAFLTHPPTH